MYATLIICQQEPATSSELQPVALTSHMVLHQLVQSASHLHWKLTADELTTGKLMDLLICLDELGFSEVE